MKVVRTRAAQSELASAVRYYKKVSSTAADGFLDELEQTVARIVEFPRLPAPMAKDMRSRSMKRFPYQVVYRIEGDTIRIYAVAHFKRRADYWLRRVAP